MLTNLFASAVGQISVICYKCNSTRVRSLYSSTKDARAENKRSVKVCLRSLSSLEGLIVEKKTESFRDRVWR